MSSSSTFPRKGIAIAACIVAIVGLCDASYLTYHHYTAEPVPCSITNGCEMVLTSQWATIAGLPLAIYGAAAYLIAFVWAALTVAGLRAMWFLYGLQALSMAVFSGWLLYIQGALIGAFCQFCLLSAATSIILLLVFIISIFFRRKAVA